MRFTGCLSNITAATLLGLGCAIAATISPVQVNPQEIVRRSVDAIQYDWSQGPKYSYLEHDVDTKHGAMRTSKTYRVLMIDGSPYDLVTGLDDHPLSPQERAAEERKLQKEIIHRRNESAWARQRRLDKFMKANERNHQMLKEMVDAFQFRLAGQATVDGHDCWVLDARPKSDYDPVDHEGRVLKGMQGQLWIDKTTYQWVRVRAEVVKPVSLYGFLAKVGPGTQFYLEQEPVENGVWLPKMFKVQVQATALGLFNEDSTDDETYRDYEPMPQAIAMLQSTN